MYNVTALTITRYTETRTVLATIDELTEEALAAVCTEVFDFEIDEEDGNAADAFIKFGKRVAEVVVIEPVE